MNAGKKKIKGFLSLKFLIGLFLLIIIKNANAQLSEGGVPYGLQTNNPNFNQIKNALNNQVQITEPNIDSLKIIAANSNNSPYLFAKSININLNIKSKQPIILNDESKLWIWKFSTKNASTLNAYFSKYILQNGAKLFIYRPDSKQILGAFSTGNNQEHETFSVGFVEGNEIVIEYFEPNDIESEKSEIVLGVLGYGFRDGLNKFNELKVNESSTCNLNVNCSTNSSIQTVKKSVAKILYQAGSNWYVCSGSVVNNTNQDGTPYFLTAFHCYNGSNLNSYIFYFNYESPNCTNPTSTPPSNTLSGASLKSAWSGSDFALIQINNTPPLSYNVFYAGFDATDGFPTNTIGIHHPQGDIKKYSTDNQAPTKGSVTIEGQTSAIWNTKFDNGTTQGGSSGSPLFNNSFRVIAQLYGVGWNYGPTYDPCNLQGNTQYYGRLGISWEGGGSASTRLKDWLNPSNNNTKVLDGIFYTPATISTSTSNTTFCQGASLTVNYTKVGTFNTGNVFTAQLSNSLGSFSNPINIGSFSSTVSGSISATIPVNTVSGSAYRIRVISSNPVVTGSNNGANITINSVPVQPSAFTVSSSAVCKGTTNVTYTVPTVAGATSYTWSYSGIGATISGTTNSVTVNFSATATSGTLSVSATNSCGNSTARTLAITVNSVPVQPSAFTTSTSTLCQATNNVVYTVPTVAGATSYTWTYSGTGATITGTSNSVTVNFSGTATSGNLSVTANNTCGSSTARTLAITVNRKPAQPEVFTASTITVCQTTNNVVYAVPAVAGATSYTWTYSGTGATITGTSNSVTVNFSGTATSGNLSVTANNTCGSSTARTLAINVNGIPGQASAFTTSSTSVCKGTNNVIYTVPAVGEASSYFWSFSGTGASFSSTTNTVSISFSTSATSGTLSVVAINSCGTGAARTLAITLNVTPSIPSTTASKPIICSGSSTTLSASGCAGNITWSNGATGSSVSVSPTSDISYTAICTINNCVSGVSNSVIIKVIPISLSINSTTLPPFQATDNIITNGNLIISGNTTFKSGQSILIIPTPTTSVSTSVGAVFVAQIENCNY